ncbi:uncharacterized protein BDR25DRAFT_294042 [Lindgomyces ingoldianus]|uniref:Uncharacterized protein n=1 Tax=Lindgomyces ingoldianus TaxID=673940 RepID=A0ACB6QIT3_9PLEO|nr:uncharacterized protein BDR25DRAFT_294042 [Lindgomyces ingoldianus]KAF2466027.1 hypothetical protein BDR25DRAFT_294042 [Lindgomyces ingoldianus]
MVYRGKPSKSCGECRKRRTKCDQSAPACGQCVKAKRVCPGYRNTVDLMFFDESCNVTKKHRSRTPTCKDSVLGNLFHAENYNSVAQHRTAVRLTDVVFYQPLNELGVNFFMSNYVGTDAMQSQFDYLPEFYLRNGYSYPHIRDSIRAVGLAGYARLMRQPGLDQPAAQKYVAAIREVNLALSRPDTAGNDATLLSVMLLGMYEVLIRPREQGLENLTKHLNGAISIANLGDKQRWKTDLRGRLLGTLNQNVIMNCWIQNLAVPADFLRLKDQMREMSDQHPDPHSNFLDLILELLNFRYFLENRIFESPAATIAEAIVLDNKLLNFVENMPENGRFRVILSSGEDDLVFKGYYHAYARNFTAHLWNNVRSSRIRLHNVVLVQCRLLQNSASQVDISSLDACVKVSEAVIKQVAREICATVPQLAGYMVQLQSYKLPQFCQHYSKEEDGKGLTNALYNNRVTSTSVPPGNHFAVKSTPLPSVHEPPADRLPQAVPSLPIPKPQSLYHILYQLHALSSIDFLPPDMLAWINGRIAWVEGIATPDNLALLKTMLKSRFTESEVRGQIRAEQTSHFEVLWLGGISPE